uniref:Uncharacterized protein n=1 Tax=Anguilla anguilla TaxID=7936 RepID=A0A0E9VES0_ANGAN
MTRNLQEAVKVCLGSGLI